MIPEAARSVALRLIQFLETGAAPPGLFAGFGDQRILLANSIRRNLIPFLYGFNFPKADRIKG